jgi:hypothetical protein
MKLSITTSETRILPDGLAWDWDVTALMLPLGTPERCVKQFRETGITEWTEVREDGTTVTRRYEFLKES